MEQTMDSGSLTVESREESKFAAVVFHNIQEVYVPGKDIRCCYSIKPSVSPTPNDWIGLYRVGWQSYKDYLCYEYSPVIQKDADNDSVSSQNSVLFRGNKLPQEDVEFYQFCYVTSEGGIRGASYPFQIQFSKPGELECNEEEDENGDTLLVVRNRTTMLEDSLEKAFDENAALKASKEKAEADCATYQDMILELESQKNTINTQLREQKKDTEEIMREKNLFEESLNESAKKIMKLEQALQEARDSNLELLKSVEVEKLRSAQTDEDQKKLEEERMQLLQRASDAQKEVDRLNEVVEKNNSEIVILQEKSEKITRENEVLGKEHKDMLGEVKTTQTSMEEAKRANLAMEKSLAEHLEHMNLLQKENCKLRQELDERNLVHEAHLREINCCEEQAGKVTKKLQDKEKDLSAAEEKIAKISKELEEERAIHQQLMQEYEDSLSNIQDQLNQERAFNNSLSTASDRQVAELQDQLNLLLEKNSNAYHQIELKTQEIRRLEEEVKAKEKVIASMELLVSEQEHELESAKNRENEQLQSKADEEGKNSEKNSALDGPYFALQTAHAQLKKQYLQAKKDMENLWRQKSDLRRQLTTLQSDIPDSDLRFQMANLKKQIEDLRIRLNMGAEAYKAKFKECRKYQNQLKKVQKSISGRTTPQSPLSVTDFEIRNLKQSLENEKTATAATKKSLENYKNEAHEAKQELEQLRKECDGLNRKVSELQEDAVRTNDEKEKRLVEDKELQSHIDCLHKELQARTDSMKSAEEDFKKITEEKDCEIAALTEENRKLQSAVESKSEEVKKELLSENKMLQDEVLKQKKLVENLDSELGQLRERESSLVRKISELESTQSSGAMDIDQGQPSAPILIDESNPQQQPALVSSSKVQNVCPVCNIFFPPNCAQTEFEGHVQSHFSD